MPHWIDAALLVAFGALWLVGLFLVDLDRAQKLDELRRIDDAVWRALSRGKAARSS